MIDAIRSKEAEIPSVWLKPPSTDDRFAQTRGGVTIFLAAGQRTLPFPEGEEVMGAGYVEHSYLLDSTDPDRMDDIERTAEAQAGTRSSARYFELVLREALGDPTADLQHIKVETAGPRTSGLFPNIIFGFKSAILGPAGD
jgi:hypothetical protein